MRLRVVSGTANLRHVARPFAQPYLSHITLSAPPLSLLISAYCILHLIRCSIRDGLSISSILFAAVIAIIAAASYIFFKSSVPVSLQLRCYLHLAATYSCIFQPPPYPMQIPAITITFSAAVHRQVIRILFFSSL
jgi:hypothetical protein